MKKILVFILWLFFLSNNQAISKDNSYRKFQSYANPLFFPWTCDEEFLRIDNSFPVENQNLLFKEGRYLQYKLSKLAAKIPEGDFIELGVFKGKSIDIFASVLDLYDCSNKEIYGVDSFEGLAEPNEDDIDVRTNSPFFKKGGLKGFSKNTIYGYLSKHKCKIHLVKGWIPNVLQDLEEKRFSFVHIDVDLFQATYDSLEFVYPRLVKGAVVLFDDYGFPMCIGARKAIDNFMSDKQEVLIPIPTGQAFFIKQ